MNASLFHITGHGFIWNYTLELTANHPMTQPHSLSSKNHYYETIIFQVSETGSYSFYTTMSIQLHAQLYNTSFNPNNTSLNNILSIADRAFKYPNSTNCTLIAGKTYVLIITTHDPNTTGVISISGSSSSGQILCANVSQAIDEVTSISIASISTTTATTTTVTTTTTTTATTTTTSKFSHE